MSFFFTRNMVKGKEKSNVSLRRDPSWKYSVQVDVGGEKTYVYLKCNFCGKVVKGGVTRMKEHLSCSHKNVAPCASVPDNVKDEIAAYMKKSTTTKHLQQEQFDERIEQGAYYGSESGNGSTSTINNRDVASDNEWFIDDETNLPLSDLQLEDLSVDVLRGDADQGGASTSATPHTSTSSASKEIHLALKEDGGGEMMMKLIKILWFRRSGSSWSLVHLVRGAGRANLIEGSLSATIDCFVQGDLYVDWSLHFNGIMAQVCL
ncbi:hypothetical protein M5K25_018192 [Dendrobium thyrsiflorum]|uniref:BED-type domain-containing protein n=1 Tax=Dendrobium thyrsiflorum TaxID=117978 RepID=A0ABD0UID0_DENTH